LRIQLFLKAKTQQPNFEKKKNDIRKKKLILKKKINFEKKNSKIRDK
jgi:hypothetical protein